MCTTTNSIAQVESCFQIHGMCLKRHNTERKTRVVPFVMINAAAQESTSGYSARLFQTAGIPGE